MIDILDEVCYNLNSCSWRIDDEKEVESVMSKTAIRKTSSGGFSMESSDEGGTTKKVVRRGTFVGVSPSVLNALKDDLSEKNNKFQALKEEIKDLQDEQKRIAKEIEEKEGLVASLQRDIDTLEGWLKQANKKS